MTLFSFRYILMLQSDSLGTVMGSLDFSMFNAYAILYVDYRIYIKNGKFLTAILQLQHLKESIKFSKLV